jgi:hypothetical protein
VGWAVANYGSVRIPKNRDRSCERGMGGCELRTGTNMRTGDGRLRITNRYEYANVGWAVANYGSVRIPKDRDRSCERGGGRLRITDRCEYANGGWAALRWGGTNGTGGTGTGVIARTEDEAI